MKKMIVFCSILLLLVPFTALAQDACEGNSDCDQDVDGTDAPVFKTDFGRIGLKNPCPASSNCCSGTLSPLGRWCDQNNGTVKDMTTGLMWLKKVNWGGQYPLLNGDGGADAHRRAASLWDGSSSEGNAGLSDGSVEGDWRLPTKSELQGIIGGVEYISANRMYKFDNVQSGYYWSDRSCAGYPDGTGDVYIGGGNILDGTKTTSAYVWPVRRGQ